MRIVLKIILFPVSIFLSVLTAFIKFVHGIGTTILYILMLFCIIGATAGFVQRDTTTCIQALIIGFLVSPYGLQLLAAVAIRAIEGMKERIKQIRICGDNEYEKI